LTRRGFTLVELLIAAIVAGILGTALARLLVSDSRFAARQQAMLSSRSTARTAMNWLAIDLRTISDGGLRGASRDTVAVRVPYAFGTACNKAGGLMLMALVPTDSLIYGLAVPSGLAWRPSTGTYAFISPVSVSVSTDSATCAADSIRVVPDGRLVGVAGVPSGVPLQPVPGSIAYLYQTVSYKFAPSADLPGRIGLWRKAGLAAYEELVAPFDTTAGFGFLVGSSFEALDDPPADLSTVSGLELRLVGASEFVPRGADRAQTFQLVTQIRFANTANH